MGRGKQLYWEQQEEFLSECLKDTRHGDILQRQQWVKKLLAVRHQLAVLDHRTIVRWFKEPQ